MLLGASKYVVTWFHFQQQRVYVGWLYGMGFEFLILFKYPKRG